MKATEAAYICYECAMKHGATADEDHACTCHSGKCDLCGETKTLCHHDDYNWPGQRYYPGRD